MLKYKKGDKIIIISGKYKGKKGKINKIKKIKEKIKVSIDTLKYIKRFVKKGQTKKDTKKGYIVFKELFIDISNIALIDPKYKTKTRVGFDIINGEKVRIYKKSRKIVKNNFKKNKKNVYT
ncbi:MAG: 50S ribosomal protein L24 [Candidatus Shikimatogenerans bostrichidophilus]|nr:MAG: 50S ribosomal protein L24 [Candidatus Shikimatogenerans bostrichidophilus]